MNLPVEVFRWNRARRHLDYAVLCCCQNEVMDQAGGIRGMAPEPPASSIVWEVIFIPSDSIQTEIGSPDVLLGGGP